MLKMKGGLVLIEHEKCSKNRDLVSRVRAVQSRGALGANTTVFCGIIALL
jgi:hypothetical protein